MFLEWDNNYYINSPNNLNNPKPNKDIALYFIINRLIELQSYRIPHFNLL